MRPSYCYLDCALEGAIERGTSEAKRGASHRVSIRWFLEPDHEVDMRRLEALLGCELRGHFQTCYSVVVK